MTDLNLRTSIPDYLANARTLVLGVQEDSFIKERMLPYNVTDERITEYVQIYYDAEKPPQWRLL